MSDQWYYADGSEARGPISKRELKDRAQGGKLTSATMVWREGMAEWVAAGTLGLKEGPPPIKPPQPPSVPSKAVSPKPAAVPPAPPTRYTAPPPRPVAASGNQTTTVVAAGVALLAGLAIGWLGHAMLAAPREKPVAAAANVNPPANKVVAPSIKPATGPTRPTALQPAAVNSPSPVAAPPAAPAAVPETTSPPPSPAATPSATPTIPIAGPPPANTTGIAGEPATPSATPTSTPPAGTTPNSQSASNSQRKFPAITLYQEIDVQRASKMPILETISQTQYQFLSQLEVSDPDAEGIRTVGQTVLDTKLLKADPLSQANYDEALKKLKGWQFSYTLARDGEVLKMAAGPADAPMVAKVEPMGNKGFLVTSVMDEAGWKELAQMSFYVPDAQPADKKTGQASGNKRQVRQMTHDLGPLGSFSGETTFVRKGTQQGLLRIDYAHKVAYRAPAAAAAIGGSELTIKGADLRPDVAGGSIWYDQKAKRVRQAEDYFHLKGEINTNLAALPIEEQQAMIVKLTDVNPWNK